MDLEDYIKKLIQQMMIGENNYKNNENEGIQIHIYEKSIVKI